MNWLAYLSHSSNHWNGHRAPWIKDTRPILRGKDLLGWQFTIRPSGYVVVPSRRELPPIQAYSESARWPEGAENPFLEVVRDAMGIRFDQLTADDQLVKQERFGKPVPSHPEHEAWARYAVPPPQFLVDLEAGSLLDVVEVGPLLTTQWHQDIPFNQLCPVSEGHHTYVGCTATAMAQLMKYHEWPPWGIGTTGYQWDGDDCAAVPEGAWLEVDLTEPFDWDSMPDAVTVDTPQKEQQALARLSYDVAVSCRMDFGTCGSAASSSMARAALMDLFHYQLGIREVVRFRYSTAGWFAEIQDDIDQGHPIIYSTVIHTLVCDGWRDVDGLQQIHLNYGWGGASNNWYSLDDIETSLNPAAERMILDIAPDTTAVFPLDVLSFDVTETQTGVEVEWEVPVAGSTAEFTVMRSGGSVHSCVPSPLTAEPLTGGTSYEFVDQTISGGDYDYWLKAISAVGDEIWFGPARVTATVGVASAPEASRLSAPVPNPANPRAVIAFTLGEAGPVRLTIVDPRGRRVRSLLNDSLPAGGHERIWNGRTDEGRSAPSGVYFVRLVAGASRETQKLLLAR